MEYIEIALLIFGCLILSFSAGYVLAKVEEVRKYGK